jgi:hypothetical protein
MSILHIKPAYGRVYHTTCAAVQDWLSGKNFRIADTSTYLSIRDAEQLRCNGYTVVRIYPNMLNTHFETKIL